MNIILRIGLNNNSSVNQKTKIEKMVLFNDDRIIKDTLKANRIELVDEKASDKNKRYVPIWA